MLIRPFHKKGESFQSYVYRSARANGWTSDRLKQFLRLEVAPLYSYKAEDRQKIRDWLSNISGHTEVAALTDVWIFYNDCKEYFDFARIKVCPSCYSESSGAIPAYWYLRTYLVCLKHKKLLTDVCTCCDEKLTAETVIAGRCLNCHNDIASFDTEGAKPDIYSEKAYEVLYNCKTHEVFSAEVEHLYLPLLRSINILAPLTGLAAEIGYEHKQRRFLSIKQLHRYQLACSELYQDREKLTEYLAEIVNEHVGAGSTNLGKIFLRQVKELEDINSRFFVHAVRNLVVSGKLVHEELIVTLSWIARLFEYDETTFVQHVEKESSSLIKRRPRENIQVIHVPEIISRFESKNESCPK